jgi:zinc and cadmium transporter
VGDYIVLINAAFLVDTDVGVVTAMAVIAHEIPQEVGDYIVLINAGFSRARALVYNLLSGLAAVAGGVLGYFLIGPWREYLPYMMVVAASSFVYVAVADLIPQLQKRLSGRDTIMQIVWMGAGMGAIVTMTLAISLIVTILSMYTGFRTTDPEKLRLMRRKASSRSNRRPFCPESAQSSVGAR